MSSSVVRESNIGIKCQIWLILISQCLFMLAGSSIGTWSSPSIPKLLNMGYSESMTSLSVSIYTAGQVTGSVLSIGLLYTVGRKWIILLCSWLMLVSALSVFAIEIPILLNIGRFIGGFTYSILGIVVPIYSAECLHPKDRAIFSGLLSSFIALGFFLEYVVAPFISYNMNNIMIVLINCIGLLTFSLVAKESPTFLIKKQNETQAISVMMFFWSLHEDDKYKIKEEIDKIKADSIDSCKIGILQTWINTFKLIYSNKAYLKSTLIVFLLLIGAIASGTVFVLVFIEPIIINAETPYSPALCSSIIGVIMVIFAAFTTFVIKSIGVKKTLIICAAAQCASSIVMGVYFWLKAVGYKNLSTIYWLPIASIAVDVIAITSGVGFLPYSLRGELLQERIQGIISPLSDFFANIIGFLSSLLFVYFSHQLYIPFGIFSAASFTSLILFIIFVPDTKNLLKSEIHELFDSK